MSIPNLQKHYQFPFWFPAQHAAQATLRALRQAGSKKIYFHSSVPLFYHLGVLFSSAKFL
jgi:hypothetical protein